MAKKKKKDVTKHYTVERAELYFQRKFSTAIPVLLLAALIAFGYALLEGGGGPLYFVVSAMLAGIAVWQYFYTHRTVVRGTEVDETARRVIQKTDVKNRAWNASDLDVDDFESFPQRVLAGYTNLPVGKREALLRADEEDGRGRSSHLQLCCFTVGDEALEAYSLVRCLFNDELTEENMTWQYVHLAHASLEFLSLSCPRAPGSQEKITRNFPVLTLRSDNKRIRRSYAFMEEDRAAAEDLLNLIRQKLPKETQ